MSDFVNNQSYFDDDPLNSTGVSKRSLVLFFLIDVSGSMKGTKIGELNTAMEELIPEIRRIGEADTDVKIAILKFSTGCSWMYSEPISIEEFEWSRLTANGITDMGDAFTELSTKMSRSNFLNAPSLSFAPVIFLMTDGYPTDDYKAGLKRLNSNTWYKYALKVALGIGKEANDAMLAEFTENPDTVVHAYSGVQLANLIKKVAVTSSQIGSKSMTLTDNGSNRELSEQDVANRKQQELGKQIKDIAKNDEFSDVFDAGW
ncbi:MAG: VWA domain-containing protein [Ruminococcus sp.]|nr:VWA domain-containing protein [Ruminococcus sp.]MCD7800022.1 VWA domain-containing protein [Ruminococcus sp.]